MNKIRLSKYVKKVFETPDSELSVWFGYYNYDPLSPCHTKLLCNRISKDGIRETADVCLEEGYYDITTGSWEQIGITDSWNWQQGAMLQWLSEDEVVYNVSKNNRLIARIHNTHTGLNRDLNWSIYGLTPDRKHSITINMERSYWCRAYHYESVINPIYNCLVAPDDGVFDIDIEKNERRRIIDISDVINCDYRNYFDGLQHWVEHIMISPTGKRFCFLHRFSTPDSVNSYATRLCIADIDGSNLQVIPGWETNKWSHFGWNGDDSFVIYAVVNATVPLQLKKHQSLSTRIESHNNVVKTQAKSKLTSFIKDLIPEKYKLMYRRRNNGYQMFSLVDGRFKQIGIYNQSLFHIDGHPSFTKDGRYMITDTYPDYQQYQHLIVFDTITKKGVIIAKLFANYFMQPSSCDLHPKLSKDEKTVTVDTAFDSKHHMFVLDLDWEKIKESIS